MKSVLNSKEPSYLLYKEPICYRFYNVQVQNNKVKLTIQQRDITENNVAIIKQLQEEEKEIAKWKRCKESRLKHVSNQTPKSFKAEAPAAPESETRALSQLEIEFPELTYLSRLDTATDVVLSRKFDDEGIWKSVSYSE